MMLFCCLQHEVLIDLCNFFNACGLQASDGTVIQTRKPTIQVLSSTASPSTYQLRITTCKTELQQLIQQKREQCNAERLAKQMMENAEWESKPPPPGNGQGPGVIRQKLKSFKLYSSLGKVEMLRGKKLFG